MIKDHFNHNLCHTNRQDLQLFASQVTRHFADHALQDDKRQCPDCSMPCRDGTSERDGSSASCLAMLNIEPCQHCKLTLLLKQCKTPNLHQPS